MSELTLIPSKSNPASAERRPVSERIRANRSASKSPETKRALAKNWNSFEAWCKANAVPALPAHPRAVEEYLVYLADDRSLFNRRGHTIGKGLKPASVLQALWAINQVHRLAGAPEPGNDPMVRTAMAGIRRRKAHRQKQQAPLTIDDISQLRFPPTLKGLRDKALLLIGFAGCLRRSEIVALQAEHIEPTAHGIRIYITQSKTDAMGKGAWVDIVRARHHLDNCPVTALQTWLSKAGIVRGPIFQAIRRNAACPSGSALSAVVVDHLVKSAAAELGLDPTLYGGHSLRAGRATYLARQNKPPTLVAKHGRWQSLDMVLRYYRDEVAEGLAGAY